MRIVFQKSIQDRRLPVKLIKRQKAGGSTETKSKGISQAEFKQTYKGVWLKIIHWKYKFIHYELMLVVKPKMSRKSQKKFQTAALQILHFEVGLQYTIIFYTKKHDEIKKQNMISGCTFHLLEHSLSVNILIFITNDYE